MASNTSIDVGIRLNFSTLGDRNFEVDGSVQYKCNREGLEFLGGTYHVGDTLPFDGNGAYTATALKDLQLYWDQGFLTPAT